MRWREMERAGAGEGRGGEEGEDEGEMGGGEC